MVFLVAGVNSYQRIERYRAAALSGAVARGATAGERLAGLQFGVALMSPSALSFGCFETEWGVVLEMPRSVGGEGAWFRPVVGWVSWPSVDSRWFMVRLESVNGRCRCSTPNSSGNMVSSS